MSDSLTLAFPMPDSPELKRAYRQLFLAVNGTAGTKKRMGDPAHLPRPWDPPTCRKPALRRELWVWLEEVVIWFNHEYVWDHNAGLIPGCWPQHPHLVHEVALLADQRRRAALDNTSSSLEDWHRFCVPAFLERLKNRTKNSCDEHHTSWPAERRFARHTSRDNRAARAGTFKADVAELTPASPVQPLPPRLEVVRTANGDLVDPVTGEAF